MTMKGKWSWRLLWLKEIDPPPVCGIYFVQNANGYIKIGQSGNIARRMEQYQTHSPMLTWLVGYIKTDDWKDTEESLHEYFKECKVGGEWFAPVDALLDYLRNFDNGKGMPLEEMEDYGCFAEEQEKRYQSIQPDSFRKFLESGAQDRAGCQT